MKKIILVILSLVVFLPAIAKHKKSKKKKQATNPITYVKIFRTGCFGQCPTYMVQIDADGTATYSAIRFNADTGIFKKNIGKAKAMEVLNEVNSYRPDSCKDEYDNRVPDVPGLNIQIKYTDKTKNILNAKYGPGYLQLLGNHIDAAGKKSDNVGWEKVGSKVN